MLNFIRYDGQGIRLTHPRVALPYIMYKCNTWVSKSDSLPFIPNRIEQSRGRCCNGIFCVETRRSSTENNGKRPDARKIGTQKLLPRIRARQIYFKIIKHMDGVFICLMLLTISHLIINLLIIYVPFSEVIITLCFFILLL